MTENASRNGMDPFENPDLLPLNELKLTVRKGGVVEAVNALNKRWAEDRYFLHYESPKIYNDDGTEVMGAKEHWMEIVGYLIDDIKWLLSLPFYKFWSNVVFNTSVVNTLVSFLQEAPPFYALENFPNSPDILDRLETLRHHVLMVFARFVTNKESPSEYMEPGFLGCLLYENYIFTVPIIFDLCQLYGRENTKAVQRILGSLFKLEPSYNEDLQKSVPCLIEAFDNVEVKFNDRLITHNDEVVSLLKSTGVKEMTLFQLEDMILYILDISSTITVLLKNLPSAINIFRREDFVSTIVSIYESTIPKMYKKLDALTANDEEVPKYIEQKHRLDVTRVELLSLFRMIIHEPVLSAQIRYNTLSDTEIRKVVDEYITFLENVISEREFITDYSQFYPVHSDLETLQNLYPEIDVMKCDYILRSMYAIIEESKPPANNFSIREPAPGPSRVREEQPQASSSNNTLPNGENTSAKKDPVDVEQLILQVKDVFYDLGDGFIMECLKYYNYNYEAVINALLDKKLPKALESLDPSWPIIPPDPMEASAAVDAALGVERLNVFDNDEFDIMTRDHIDMSRVHIGKKREKYRNTNEMLNDKSEIKERRDFYCKYSLVTDDYNDEYDDTYDSHDVLGTTQDDSVEVDSRPFTTPRVLREGQKNNTASDEESGGEEETAEVEQDGKDQFVQNPAKLREKAEQRRQAARGGKSSANVVGKPRGQGQDKEVVVSRDQKNTNKATRANHNRRSGALWKRRQGMVPS